MTSRDSTLVGDKEERSAANGVVAGIYGGAADK
jgi:hypothetical protein